MSWHLNPHKRLLLTYITEVYEHQIGSQNPITVITLNAKRFFLPSSYLMLNYYRNATSYGLWANRRCVCLLLLFSIEIMEILLKWQARRSTYFDTCYRLAYPKPAKAFDINLLSQTVEWLSCQSDKLPSAVQFEMRESWDKRFFIRIQCVHSKLVFTPPPHPPPPPCALHLKKLFRQFSIRQQHKQLWWVSSPRSPRVQFIIVNH